MNICEHVRPPNYQQICEMQQVSLLQAVQNTFPLNIRTNLTQQQSNMLLTSLFTTFTTSQFQAILEVNYY